MTDSKRPAPRQGTGLSENHADDDALTAQRRTSHRQNEEGTR